VAFGLYFRAEAIGAVWQINECACVRIGAQTLVVFKR